MHLTPNFTTEELDIHEPVPVAYYGNRLRMAVLLQWFRDLAGVPLVVTNFYTSPARGATIPGRVPDSQHETASAADVVPDGITPDELARRLLAAERSGEVVPLYGQFIIYRDDGHIHISLPHTNGRPDRQKLIHDTENGEARFTLLQRVEQLAGRNPAATSAAVVLLLMMGLFLAYWMHIT